MCELVRTALSLDDTHVVVTSNRGIVSTNQNLVCDKGPRRVGGQSVSRLVLVLCVGGWEAWPIERCSNENSGRKIVRPSLIGKTQAHKAVQTNHVITQHIMNGVHG